jgi:hypothetical protein
MYTTSFHVIKESDQNKGSAPSSLKLPEGDPSNLQIQPKGSMIYSPGDNFVYVSDGTNWDRVSGVNNPVDILLPVTQHRMAKWAEDHPPGGAYPSPVLQDSAFEVDDDGNAILHDIGSHEESTFPWSNGNVMVQGSVVTSNTFGMSLDSIDPTSFIPILTQVKGGTIVNDSTTNTTTTVNGGNSGTTITTVNGGGQDLTSGHSQARGLEESWSQILGSEPSAGRPRPPGPGAPPGGTSGTATAVKMEIYENGSIAVGHGAMADIVYSGPDRKSIRNVAIGTNAGKHLSPDSMDNVLIGSDVKIVTNIGLESGVRGSTVIGSSAESGASGNVILGYKASDGGHPNVIALGSGASASDDNRLILGSGIRASYPPFQSVADGTNPYDGYLTVQIGAETYLLPLFKMSTLIRRGNL